MYSNPFVCGCSFWVKLAVLYLSMFSRLQFCNMDFVETYAGIKKNYAIPDGLLEIEFTESVMFDNWERLTSIVDQLHSCGFACSIDDFGKGYSSLGMFKI